MNLFNISWKNLWGRPFSTLISLMLLVLSVSIISLLLLLNQQLDQQFKKNIKGIDMVIGAKGSPLQLILSAVYHIDNPTGNIPLEEANRFRKHPLVKQSIPLAYGDNYKGYRILGTETTYIDHYGGELAEGKIWEKPMELTIGSSVAETMNLKVGQEIVSSHGLIDDVTGHDDAPFTIVGILKPSGTVLDQMMLGAIESVWLIHDEGHEEEEAEEEGETQDHEGEAEHAEEDREITALLITYRSPMAMVQLPSLINQGTSMMAAVTAIEVNRLFELFAVGISTLRAIAIAIMVISIISVLFSLYNSLRDRTYELALMRSLGASRWRLFWLILLEGGVLALMGYVLGMMVSRGGMALIANFIAENYRYDFPVFEFLEAELWLLPITLGLGLLAALLPAWKAYETDISKTLAEG
ncbi:MAG: FtsX-like permease family protein [Bacteroidota bacterium]